jgi:hypothetical protein
MGWPGNPTRPGQKLDCNPLTFIFLINDVVLIFLKNQNWPGQNLEPSTWDGSTTGLGLKTLLSTT